MGVYPLGNRAQCGGYDHGRVQDNESRWVDLLMRIDWTATEIERLKANYSKSPDELEKLFPGRTIDAIRAKGHRIGLRVPGEDLAKHRSESLTGRAPTRYNGGISHKGDGYKYELCPSHPRALSTGYVAQHILVFERATGVQVPPNCVVHHINGDKSDNRIENLCMMEAKAHVKYHHKGQKRSEEAREHMRAARLAYLEKERNKQCTSQSAATT